MFISCLHSKIYGQNHHISPTTHPPLTLINYPSSPNIYPPLTPHPNPLVQSKIETN